MGKAWSFPRPICGAFSKKKHGVLGHRDPYVTGHAHLGDKPLDSLSSLLWKVKMCILGPQINCPLALGSGHFTIHTVGRAIRDKRLKHLLLPGRSLPEPWCLHTHDSFILLRDLPSSWLFGHYPCICLVSVSSLSSHRSASCILKLCYQEHVPIELL